MEDKILIDSTELAGALSGLLEFVLKNFSSTNIQREDLSALSGLVSCVKCMAEMHNDDVIKLLDGEVATND